MKNLQCIYIRADGVTAFQINNSKALTLENFDGDITIKPSGAPTHAKFESWISRHLQDTCFILIDIVEEEFVIDSVPAVRKSDQVQVIKRRILQKFRDATLSQWVPLTVHKTKLIAFKKSAQEPVKVLFSALANDALLSPWLTMLKRSNVVIQSVVSPALLAQRLATQKLRAHNGLILSWAPAGLRQTLIIDKQIRFSRLSGSKTPTNGEAVMDECQRTIQYLLMSQQISRDFLRESSFTVWLVAGGISGTEKLAARISIDSSVDLELKLIPASNLNIPDHLGSLATWYSASQLETASKTRKSGYATRDLLHGYRIHKASRWIMRSSVAITSCAALSAIGSLAAKTYWPSYISEQTNRVQALNVQESTLRQDLASFPIASAQMQKMVELEQQLRDRHVNPLPILQSVANALDNRQEIAPSMLRWQRLDKAQVSEWQTVEILSKREVKETKTTPIGLPANQAFSQEDAIVAELEGSLKADTTMQQANDGIKTIADELKKYCQCEVYLAKLPFDPSATSGFNKNFLTTAASERELPKFQLRWLIKATPESKSSTDQTTKAGLSKVAG